MDVTEVSNKGSRLDHVGVEADTLDILQVTVVFKSSLEELLLFTELSNTLSVVLIPLS